MSWMPEIVPEDQDTERILLSTLCAAGNEQAAAEVSMSLCSEDFVHPGHRAVFSSLLGLVNRQEEINALTLKIALEKAGELGRVGGYTSLVDLLSAEEVVRPQVLADRLTQLRKRRQLIRMGAQIIRAASEGEEPALTIDRSVTDLVRLVQAAERGGLEHVSAFSDALLADILDRLQGIKTHGLRLGFPRFDGITQGFKPGNLIILAARPGIGKTAKALNWCLNAARSSQHAQCCFFSLEMSKSEVLERLWAAHGRIDMKAIQRNPSAIEQLAEVKSAIDNLPIHIADRGAITAREIVAQVDRIIAKTGRIDLLVVDYLQLVSSPDAGKNRQSEANRIGEISRTFKLFAKDRGLPVVVLSQLNREVEKRQDGRPQLSDLRDSGAIEQDADMVLFIHRKMKPAMEGEEEDRSADLLISKHRNGKTGIVPLHFLGEYALFQESERQTTPAQAPVSREWI